MIATPRLLGPQQIGGHRPHLVLVVPELLAGHRVQRIHVVVRGGDVHDAVDHDRRGLHRLQHFGLEHERRLELGHVRGIDLRGRVVARLRVVHVGVQEVRAVLVGGVEHGLRHGDGFRHRASGGRGPALDLLGGGTEGRQRDGRGQHGVLAACSGKGVLHDVSSLRSLWLALADRRAGWCTIEATGETRPAPLGQMDPVGASGGAVCLCGENSPTRGDCKELRCRSGCYPSGRGRQR